MKDILFSEAGDLDLSTGDIRYGESTRQHQRDILLARRGDYPLAPARGVGLADMLLGEDKSELARLIRTELAKDGQKVNRLEVSGDNIKIDAHD